MVRLRWAGLWFNVWYASLKPFTGKEYALWFTCVFLQTFHLLPFSSHFLRCFDRHTQHLERFIFNRGTRLQCCQKLSHPPAELAFCSGLYHRLLQKSFHKSRGILHHPTLSNNAAPFVCTYFHHISGESPAWVFSFPFEFFDLGYLFFLLSWCFFLSIVFTSLREWYPIILASPCEQVQVFG